MNEKLTGYILDSKETQESYAFVVVGGKVRVIASLGDAFKENSVYTLKTFNTFKPCYEVREVDVVQSHVSGGQHLNVNVLNREQLLDAQENPEKYPQLTVRISGYATRFNALTKEQQDDIIGRTFHKSF